MFPRIFRHPGALCLVEKGDVGIQPDLIEKSGLHFPFIHLVMHKCRLEKILAGISHLPADGVRMVSNAVRPPEKPVLTNKDLL